jgi:hypothetical protein
VKRVRWYAAEWPISLKTLGSRMKAHAFRADSITGFIIDRVRDNFVNGRYIEKIAYQETLTTPFGEEQVFDRILYRQLEFNLFSVFPNIELLDAPRSTQGYVGKLMELNDFAVSLAPLEIDLLKWVTAFQDAIGIEVTVDSLQVSGLELESNVTARMSLSSDKDVRGPLGRATRGKRFNLDRVQLKFPHQDRLVSILMTSSGSAKLEESILDQFIQPLRQSIPSTRSKG